LGRPRVDLAPGQPPSRTLCACRRGAGARSIRRQGLGKAPGQGHGQRSRSRRARAAPLRRIRRARTCGGRGCGRLDDGVDRVDWRLTVRKTENRERRWSGPGRAAGGRALSRAASRRIEPPPKSRPAGATEAGPAISPFAVSSSPRAHRASVACGLGPRPDAGPVDAHSESRSSHRKSCGNKGSPPWRVERSRAWTFASTTHRSTTTRRPARGLRTRQIDAGSRVVFAAAGDCGLGALAAASIRGVWGVAADEDRSHLGPHILASATKRFDRLVELSVSWYLEGRLPSGRGRRPRPRRRRSRDRGHQPRCAAGDPKQGGAGGCSASRRGERPGIPGRLTKHRRGSSVIPSSTRGDRFRRNSAHSSDAVEASRPGQRQVNKAPRAHFNTPSRFGSRMRPCEAPRTAQVIGHPLLIPRSKIRILHGPP
jgi:hypothetical protein